MAQHKVPTKNWEVVAVHLFGPMLSSNHVIVVQELGSKYPAAKLVSSTKAEVIPALREIYNYHGNPEIQLSDNGPPFNSKQVGAFANKINIKLQNIAPQHPSSNPAETFMRPLGKAMKRDYINKNSEKETLNQLLNNYRDTPHPAKSLPPAAMLW